MYDIKYYNFDLNNLEHHAAAAKSAATKIIQKAKNNNPYYKVLATIDSQEKSALTSSADIDRIARQIRNDFNSLIIVGMGGAILNPQAAISLIEDKDSDYNIYFLDNTDPYFLQTLLNKVDLSTVGILIISNSGNTLETLALTGTLINEFYNKGIHNIGSRFFCITSPSHHKMQPSLLLKLITKINATVILHEHNINGRYAGLTTVTLLAALVAGIKIREYLAGANKVITDFHNKGELSAPAKSAVAIFSLNKPLLVNLGYLQQFKPFLEWYCQIISESLGKEGKGYTPLSGLGPNDQHSMLQLYLDGPQDKIFTFFYTQNINSTVKRFTVADILEIDYLGNDYLGNQTLADVNKASFQATIKALRAKNMPIRTIILQDLSARSVGAVIAHLMIETIIIGEMMQINQFNQPAVELIKHYTSAILAQNIISPKY